MPQEPFDLVGIDIGRGHFHGSRQVQNRPVLRGRLPHGVDRIANLNGKVEFSSREALGTVLKHPLRIAIAQRMLAHGLGAPHGDVDDAGAIQTKDHAALGDRGGVVHVHDGAARALQGFIGAGNEFGTGLRQHLNGDIVRHQILLDDFAHEIEIGLRGRGKSDFNLLEAYFHQHVEHAALARAIHGFDQRLVSVPQVDAAPGRRRRNDAARPGSILEVDGGKGAVLGRRITQHAALSLALCAATLSAYHSGGAFEGLFRSCKRRPMARRVWRLAAQQQGQQAAGGGE